MNLIGTKEIETERLILKVPSMNEQQRLWKILMIPNINKYYLDIDSKFREKLKKWDLQKKFYQAKVDTALDKDRFEWSIFLKETNKCIGQINAHNSEKEKYGVLDQSIMSVGWFLDPAYQGKGYATEAALAMIDYMFKKVGISEIRTSAAICNPASWKLMERLGFTRDSYKTYFNTYTFVDEPVECYLYGMTKEEYIKFNNKKNRKV